MMKEGGGRGGQGVVKDTVTMMILNQQLRFNNLNALGPNLNKETADKL